MQETFTAGVQLGGLYTLSEIKSLIGYVLQTVEEPMPREMIVQALTENEIANYFDCCTALDELERSHNFIETEDGLTLSESGHIAVDILGKRVRYGLREKAVKTALKLLSRRRNIRQNTVTITPLSRGYSVTCVAEEGDSPLMSLTLRVADVCQAEHIKECFLSDPTRVYRTVLGSVAEDAVAE